jgi:hypothetical protein
MGVPTVTLATKPFLHAARTTARGHSIPDLPVVEISHDYLFEDEEKIRKQVEGIIAALLEGLFDSPPSE